MMRKPTLAGLTACTPLALGLLLSAAALSAHAKEEGPPSIKEGLPKPAAAPASGALSPFKSKGSAMAPTAAVEPDKSRKPATTPAAKGEASADETLQKLLAERISGSGDVILRTREPSPAKPAAGEAPPAKPAVSAKKAPKIEVAAQPTVALPPPRWDYSGDGGPERWSTLKPENAVCASGSRQSPIDIRDGIKVQLDPVQFEYQPSGFRVVDTGYTVQVNVAAGNTIQVMGRRYELVGFNFRRPSEERINGRGYDMGVHMVHKDMEGRLAVVAVLLTRGAAQPVIQSVWNNLPLERNREVEAASLIDPAKLLPDDPRYITYMGSLTTPPCTEGVLWIVMKTPVQVSAEQIAIFSRLYSMNARPGQPANGRLVKESN